MSVKFPKLYGVPLSQPFRSVAWTMLILKLPFEVELAVPGSSAEIGTRHENFKSLTPYRSSHVPLLRLDESTFLTESPAIMTHLCERSSNQLYASPGSLEKARIDSYLHWHHDKTRFLARLFQTKVRPDLTSELTERHNERIQELLKHLDSGWLEGGQFIGGMESPTIADILAYGEISAVTMTKLLDIGGEYKNLHAWAERLTELPHHTDAHMALSTLGNLKEPSSAIPKLLKAATKAGLKALGTAQESFAGK